MHVQLLGKPDCHLCQVAIKIARLVQHDVPFTLEYVDISPSEPLMRQYGHRIPILLVDGVEAGSGKVSEGEMRRAIKRARWSRPVSRILSRLRGLLKRG